MATVSYTLREMLAPQMVNPSSQFQGNQTGPDIALNAQGTQFAVTYHNTLGDEIETRFYDQGVSGTFPAVTSATPDGVVAAAITYLAGGSDRVTVHNGQDDVGQSGLIVEFSGASALDSVIFRLGTIFADSFDVARFGSGNDVVVAGIQGGDLQVSAFRRDGGAPIVTPYTVPHGANTFSDAATARLSDGNVVVVYSSAIGGQQTLAAGIVKSGNVAGEPVFDIESGGLHIDDQAEVLALDGKFVVAWRSDRGGNPDTDIYYRVFLNDGTPLTGPIRANGITDHDQSNPTLARLSGDMFTIGWEHDFNGNGSDIDVHFTIADAGGPVQLFGNDIAYVPLTGSPSSFGSGIHELIAFQAGSGIDETAPKMVTLADGTMIVVAQHSNPAGDSTISGGDDQGSGIVLRGLQLERKIEGDAGVGNRLVGDDLRDWLVGKDRADVLNGRGGLDKMEGHDGNDVYYLDRPDDIVTELLNEGTDTARLGFRGNYTLAGYVENAVADSAGLALNITGNASANTLVGNAAANVLRGLLLNDVLIGNAGNDTLDGGANVDTLIGGLGRDMMTGGTQRDVFDFNAVNETGKTATTRDVITDFQHNLDDIDVSTIDANGPLAGNGKFAFLAAKGAAFTGARGQLHWFQQNPADTANDKTIIEGDINGDKHADFAIELKGLIALGAADFLL